MLFGGKMNKMRLIAQPTQPKVTTTKTTATTTTRL
jgi:hypothetical protein